MSLLPPETSEERLKRMDFIEQTEADISGLKNLEALLSGELAKIRRKIHDRIGHLHKAASRGEPLPLLKATATRSTPTTSTPRLSPMSPMNPGQCSRLMSCSSMAPQAKWLTRSVT